jgi:DNA-binding MarR family transcriptional regulator
LVIKEEESILDRVAEGLFRMMLEHHQRHLVEMELTLPQAQALRLLRESPLATSKLAASIGISAPAVSQLTDRLVRKRLIERQSKDTDRRSVILSLTVKGAQVVDGIRARRNQVFREVLSRLSDEDSRQAIAALSKIASVLEAGAVRQMRTPVQVIEASKKAGQAPVGLAARRMRIEWD